jgi:hypothetical protein
MAPGTKVVRAGPHPHSGTCAKAELAQRDTFHMDRRSENDKHDRHDACAAQDVSENGMFRARRAAARKRNNRRTCQDDSQTRSGREQ